MALSNHQGFSLCDLPFLVCQQTVNALKFNGTDSQFVWIEAISS